MLQSVGTKQVNHVNIDLNTLHPAQQQILDEMKRFNVINCGRRFGKTSLAVELLASPDNKDFGFLNGWPMAYGTPTYKMLGEVWREVLYIFAPIIKKKDEVDKRIYFTTGGSVAFWSFEDSTAIRGNKYKGFVIDEAASIRNLKNDWTKVVRATLADMRGYAWFLSTPKGKNQYFWDLYKLEQEHSNWKSFHFTIYDNPHISREEIEEIRGQTDPLTFSQEYLAVFVTENLDAWAYAYDPVKHLAKTEVTRAQHLYLSFDFNRNPITCSVWQWSGSLFKPKIRGIEQIKLPNSNIYELCEYITVNYKGYMYMVTGDATGKASSALVQDNLNYYTVIKKLLNLSQGQLKVPPVNPTIKENRVLVNSVLHNHDIKLDPDKCKGLIFDLEHARMLPDGSLEKMDRNDPTQQLDALDTFRYFLNTFFRNLLKI